MKKIFIVLFVLIGFKGISQDLSIGLYGGINFNKINHYENKNYYNQVKYKWGASGNTGINIELLKNKFTYEVGIEYNVFKTIFSYPNIIYSKYPSYDTSEIFRNGDEWYDANGNLISFEKQYIEIPIRDLDSKSYNIIVPIKFGYIFGSNIKIIPKIGLNSIYTFRTKYELLKYNESTKEVTYYNVNNNNISKRFNFNILLELEFRYKINEKYGVFSELNYHHDIPIGDNKSKNKYYCNGFDLNFGIRYILKN